METMLKTLMEFGRERMRNMGKMNEFIDICKIHSQFALKTKLDAFMTQNGYKTYNENGFLFCVPQTKTFDPVCLTAHMDTVHKEPVKKVVIEKHKAKNETIISSPQGIGGDDRCGIWMIMEIVKSGLRPYVIFNEDEEVGCVGAGKFAEHPKYPSYIEKDCMFIVELDRRNATDAVYYYLDNLEFEEYVSEITGYKTAIGSYSDICEIAPVCGIAAVNLSCGYYEEHTPQHYVIWQEMMNTLDATKKLVMAATKDRKTFEYKEEVRPTYTSPYGYGFSDYYGYYKKSNDYDYAHTEGWSFTVFDDNKRCDEFYTGSSFEECLGQLMLDHPTICFSEIQEYVQEY